MYGLWFLRWLRTRCAWASNQGSGHPVLNASVLAKTFQLWLNQWWPTYHCLFIYPRDTNPSDWIDIFDFWYISLGTEPIPSSSSPHIMDSHQAPSRAIASTVSTSFTTRSKKHYRNEVSTLTVHQIQAACTAAGGDADAIQRLAVVFPPGGVIMRDSLKVGRGHHGYQEFSELVHGRWYCRLCKRIGSRTWKNEKDVLNHVWNKHCDPLPSR